MEIYKNIDTDNISYDKNNKTIFVKYKKKNFVFQTPKIDKPEIDKIENDSETKYYLDFKVDNSLNFHSCLENIESKLVRDIENNYSSWFNVEELDDDNYKSFLNDGIFKTKVPVDENNNLKIDIIYKNKSYKNCEIDQLEDFLDDSKKVKAIVQCTCIWNYKEKFGCSWKILNLKFY